MLQGRRTNPPTKGQGQPEDVKAHLCDAASPVTPEWLRYQDSTISSRPIGLASNSSRPAHENRNLETSDVQPLQSSVDRGLHPRDILEELVVEGVLVLALPAAN